MATSALGEWLREQLKRRRLSQNAFIAYAGLSKGTVSGIITKGHIPKPEILCVIADYFDEPRERIFQLAGLLAPSRPLDQAEEDLLHLYRQLEPADRTRIHRTLRAWLQD